MGIVENNMVLRSLSLEDTMLTLIFHVPINFYSNGKEGNNLYEYNGIVFNNANPKDADGTKAWSQICRICVSKYKIKRSMLEPV